MITIISDIHLSDGTTSFNVHEDAFREIFFNNVLNGVKDNEVKELKIILLGDIFDFVRTDYWLKIPSGDRPWNGTLDKNTGMNNQNEVMLKGYTAVLGQIYSQPSTQAFFESLNKIRTDPITNNLDIEIYYVIGNHDRVLNNFEELQNSIKTMLGEYDKSKIIFCNSFMDSQNYTVLCRHGHEYDENNFGRELYAYLNGENADEINRFDNRLYSVQSIGEVITAELMSGIIFRLADYSAEKKFVDAVKEINNIRPMSDAFIWLYWYGKEQTKKNKILLMKAFRESMHAVLDSKLGKVWDNLVKELSYFRGDITDRFEQLLDFVEDKKFDDVAKTVEFFRPIFSFFSGNGLDDYAKGARSSYASGAYLDIQYFILGHTHEALNIYFKGDTDDRVNMYINTGTYLPYIERVKNSSAVSFVSANQMTLLNIFRRDEDLNNNNPNIYPTLDLWNGIKRKKYIK